MFVPEVESTNSLVGLFRGIVSVFVCAAACVYMRAAAAMVAQHWPERKRSIGDRFVVMPSEGRRKAASTRQKRTQMRMLFVAFSNNDFASCLNRLAKGLDHAVSLLLLEMPHSCPADNLH